MPKRNYTAPTVVELGTVGELTRTEIKCNGSADINDLIPPEDTRPGIGAGTIEEVCGSGG